MSYLDLLNIKYKFRLFIIFIAIFLISLLIYILNLKMYDEIETYGYVLDKQIITRLNIDTPDMINNIRYVVIGSKRYKSTIDKVGEFSIDKDNLVNYQDVYLQVESNLKENQVFKMKVLYNEEKVWEKLKKIIL